MDVVLVDSVNFSIENAVPQLGLLSLRSRLKDEFNVAIADFDHMHFLARPSAASSQEPGVRSQNKTQDASDTNGFRDNVCQKNKLIEDNTTKDFIYSDDVDANIEKMADYLAGINASVYGFYTVCNSYPISILTAKRLKEIMPGAKIILGGPQASLTAQESLQAFDFIDAIGLGEAETYICDFIRELINGGADHKKLKGVCFRGENGIESTAPPDMLSPDELSKMSMVDMLNGCGYREVYKDVKGFQLEGGRGCPFSCTFCSTKAFWKHNYRAKSTKSLIQEMNGIHAEYGHKKFAFAHDIFTMDRAYLHEFCDSLIKKDLEYTWGCSSRIDNLDYDTIELMKKAGCNGLFVGLETGSERMQRILRKNLNIDNATRKIIYTKNTGIPVKISFIYGFPDETVEDFTGTMRVIERLLLNNVRTLQLHKLMPLPKTKELEKIASRLYFDETDIDFSIYKSSTNPISVIELIKQNPDAFPQFYTFDSEVRSKYKRMDFFLYFLVHMYKEGYLTIRYLLEKYGIIGIYDLMQDRIETSFQQMNTASLSTSFENGRQSPHMKIIKDLFAALIVRMNEVDDDIYFSNISVFEFQKTLGSFDEEEIYRFDIDILSVLRNHQDIQYNPCWIKYAILNNGKLRVSMILEVA